MIKAISPGHGGQFRLLLCVAAPQVHLFDGCEVQEAEEKETVTLPISTLIDSRVEIVLACESNNYSYDSWLKMDLSETLREVQLKDKEEEDRVKELLELSAKKYNLQKELQSSKTKLSLLESSLKKLQKEVIVLEFEVPVLEKQEVVAKETVEDLVKQCVFKDSEVGHVQDSFWSNINDFVEEGNRLLAKSDTIGSENNDGIKNARMERENKIRLSKTESTTEAMQLYEEYQQRKIEELKLTKALLEKDSLEI